MSDFGANIFDGRNPEPPAARRREAERRAEPKPVEAPKVQEVSLAPSGKAREDAGDLLFSEAQPKPPTARAKPAAERPAPKAARAPEAPRAVELPPDPAPVEPQARPERPTRAPAPPAPPAAHRAFPPREERRRDDRPRDDRRRDEMRPDDRRGERPQRRDFREEPREPREAPPPERRRPHDEVRERPFPAEPRGGRPEAAQPLPRPERAAAPAPAPVQSPASAAPSTQTVGILIDLPALAEEARTQGGEISLHKLRAGLASGRPVAAAVCFGKPGSTAPSGFELRPMDDGPAGGIQLCATALDLLATRSRLVVAPPTPALQMLAATLRKAGHSVEFAGFGEAKGEPMRRLGRDCLFVP